jgi:polar amino acid transport system ATP-binding protein
MVRDVTKSFGKQVVLDQVSLSLAQSEVLAILGPSGSGKSTLLRCINGLEKLDGGEVLLGGRRVDRSTKEIYQLRQRIGFVFQSFNLFAHLSALQNVMLGPIAVNHRPRAEVAEEAHALLAKVGVSHRENALPSQLSGGEQQRVAIARSLAMHPDVILFDEPTSALDPENVGSVLATIRALAEDGMAMIVVTHEISFARDVAHSVCLMDLGKVIETGKAGPVLDNPATSRMKAFLSTVHRQ